MDLRAQLGEAKELHRQGRLAEAEQLYRRIVEADPGNSAARHFLGALKFQQGRTAEALALIAAALEIDPNDFAALSSYGQALMTAGRFAEALAAFDKMVAIKPGVPQLLYNRALALAMLGRFEEALAGYDASLAIRPDFAAAWINRGIALRALKHFEESLASHDRALALAGGVAEAHYNRGAVLADLGRLTEATEAYDHALAIRPDFALAWIDRGIAQWMRGRFDEALASYDRALAIDANDAMAWSNKAAVQRALGRPGESLASCDKALALRPDFAAALANRGAALKDLGRFSEALASYDGVVRLEPENADAWNHRGAILANMNRFDEALASYNKTIALRPDHAAALHDRGYILWCEREHYKAAITDLERAVAADPIHAYARGSLLHVRMHGADWRDFEREKALIDQGIREGHLVVRPFAYQAISDSPADLQACSRIFSELFPAMPGPQIPRNRRHDRIRIGYVSADFREQATAYLTAGLYEAHDKDKFEIVAFDNGGGDNSAIRRRVEMAFDKLVDIRALSDREAAGAVAAEEIDILVNLNGYFGASRMGLFACRAAPVQVNYLGFPATLGASYIDYIVADKIVIPEGERHYYAEQVVWLPDSYQANDDKRLIAPERPARADIGLPQDAFVFCNFNQSYKLTPSMFAVWMRILKRTPGSVLWLRDGVSALRENLRQAAEHHGVESRRLVFSPHVALEAHLARLGLADLFLDSLPYNAHTTASDALWAGLPLLTCRGTTFPGRVAASLLHAAGLPELVTENLEEYERRAVELAGDAPQLDALRRRLAENRLSCPLFDTDRFRRHIEAAYRTMWEIWQRGEQPHAFQVQPLA